MNKINWKVRLKNPVFLMQLALAILLPVLTYCSMEPADLTTWQILGTVLFEAIQNPFLLATVAVSVWNAVNDPLTYGITDSKQALQYSAPKKEDKA